MVQSMHNFMIRHGMFCFIFSLYCLFPVLVLFFGLSFLSVSYLPSCCRCHNNSHRCDISVKLMFLCMYFIVFVFATFIIFLLV